MEEKIKKSIFVIDCTIVTIAMIVSVISTNDKSILILFLYGVFLYGFTMKNFRYYLSKVKEDNNSRKDQYIDILLQLVEIVAIVFISLLDSSYCFLIILAIVLQGAVLKGRTIISIIYLIFYSLLSYILIYIKAHYNVSYSLKIMLMVVAVYLGVVLIFYLISYLIEQNKIIEQSLKEITIKKMEKDALYDDLRRAYERIESITALKERNRIAAEIHDTVGHTLTTVLVELEASKRLMNKNMDKAKEKLSLAQGQVRKGLNDIRSSVRVLADGKDILSFFKSLEAIINQCEVNSSVVINRNIDKELKIKENHTEIILSALMEGLSNGLRHGESTYFEFILEQEEDNVMFSLKDNGKGAKIIVDGFGIKSLRTRIEEEGGSLWVISEKCKGFTLAFKMPLEDGGVYNE